MIALFPSNPPMESSYWTTELPHMTLVYAGKIADLEDDDFNLMVIDAFKVALSNEIISLETAGVETFGPEDERVDVIRLIPTDTLLKMYDSVKQWNHSNYLEFKPHVTIGVHPTIVEEIPKYITFDTVAVCYGDLKKLFKLHKGIE